MCLDKISLSPHKPPIRLSNLMIPLIGSQFSIVSTLYTIGDEMRSSWNLPSSRILLSLLKDIFEDLLSAERGRTDGIHFEHLYTVPMKWFVREAGFRNRQSFFSLFISLFGIFPLFCKLFLQSRFICFVICFCFLCFFYHSPIAIIKTIPQ